MDRNADLAYFQEHNQKPAVQQRQFRKDPDQKIIYGGITSDEEVKFKAAPEQREVKKVIKPTTKKCSLNEKVDKMFGPPLSSKHALPK